MNWLKRLWLMFSTPLPAEPTKVSIKQSAGGTSDASPQTTYSNFTPRAQELLRLARKNADRFNHNFVGTEHLLLGMIALGQGTAVNVLRKMGLDLDRVREEVETQVGTGPDQKMLGNIPYTPRVKKVLAMAAKEARALNHTYVGTEHILLGLLREGDGVAARVLQNLNVDIEQTRQEILKELDPNFAESAAPAGSPPATGGFTPPKSETRVVVSETKGEPIDTAKRYDIYCTVWGQGVTVYRNARFKKTKHLFQRTQYDYGSVYLELELSNGQTIFVARWSVIRFCDPGAPPGGEALPQPPN